MDDAAAEKGPLRPAGGSPGVSGVDGIVTGAAYGVLAVLGMVMGLIGSFAYPWTLGPFPFAAVLLAVANFGVMLLAGLAMGGKPGALVPAVGWMAVVLILQGESGEGDLIITGTAEGYVFLFGGMLAAGAAILRTPSAHPPGTWLLRGGGG